MFVKFVKFVWVPESIMKAYTVAVNAAETSLVSPIHGIVCFLSIN